MEWDLGEDDALAILPRNVLDFASRLDHNTASPRSVGVAYPLISPDMGTCREVRPLDMLHQLFDAGVGVSDEVHNRVANFSYIVRRDVGSHSDRDARCTVNQQIWKTGWEDRRLFKRLIEVFLPIDGLALNVAEHVLGYRCEFALGVSHRGWRVAIDAPEVALSIDQWLPHRERLRHSH